MLKIYFVIASFFYCLMVVHCDEKKVFFEIRDRCLKSSDRSLIDVIESRIAETEDLSCAFKYKVLKVYYLLKLNDKEGAQTYAKNHLLLEGLKLKEKGYVKELIDISMNTFEYDEEKAKDRIRGMFTYRLKLSLDSVGVSLDCVEIYFQHEDEKDIQDVEQRRFSKKIMGMEEQEVLLYPGKYKVFAKEAFSEKKEIYLDTIEASSWERGEGQFAISFPYLEKKMADGKAAHISIDTSKTEILVKPSKPVFTIKWNSNMEIAQYGISLFRVEKDLNFSLGKKIVVSGNELIVDLKAFKNHFDIFFGEGNFPDEWDFRVVVETSVDKNKNPPPQYLTGDAKFKIKYVEE